MRYRIQIEPMLGSTLCIVATYNEHGSVLRVSSRLYTISGDDVGSDDLVEILGELQRMIGETVG